MRVVGFADAPGYALRILLRMDPPCDLAIVDVMLR